MTQISFLRNAYKLSNNNPWYETMTVVMSEVGGIVHSDAQILIAGILSRYNATLLRHTSNDPAGEMLAYGKSNWSNFSNKHSDETPPHISIKGYVHNVKTIDCIQNSVFGQK